MGQSTGGYELVLSGVILALLGLWLDRTLGTTPILTILLAVAGFVGATANLFYRYKRDIARLEAETLALRKAAE
jgi:F0F1-type ATP synthase assembly protein I